MRLHARTRLSLFLFVLVLVTGLIGCGGSSRPTAEVSGTLTFNGKPPEVLGISITFLPADGQPVSVGVNKDGTFKGQGIPVGENRLGLNYGGLSGDDEPRPTGRGAKKTAKKADPDAELKTVGIKIPQKLKDPQTSGKTITIDAGKENILNWEVK